MALHACFKLEAVLVVSVRPEADLHGPRALFANGATGPLAALMTLLPPPEIKGIALSVYEFVSFAGCAGTP